MFVCAGGAGPGPFLRELASAPQCLPTVGLTLPLLWRLWPLYWAGEGAWVWPVQAGWDRWPPCVSRWCLGPTKPRRGLVGSAGECRPSQELHLVGRVPLLSVLGM